MDNNGNEQQNPQLQNDPYDPFPQGDPQSPQDDDNKGLKTALHSERQARKEAEKALSDAKAALEAAKKSNESPEIIERLTKMESELKRTRDLQPFVAELSDPVIAEAAFGYYEKLTEGINDETVRVEMRKRAINLALMDKNPSINPITRVIGSMHGSSNPPSGQGVVSPNAIEMAKSFGIDPEKLKSNRSIKGLYNS